jgi:dTMP kinase
VTGDRGRFIVVEGIDGAGTTTQAQRLCDHLTASGRRAHLTREPSDGPVGLLIRDLLRGAHKPFDAAAMALAFAADRLDHLAREIVPRLDDGVHVVSDRYVLSSYVYQTRFVDPDFVWRINAAARPADLTVLIDVPVEIAATRRASRGGPEEIYDALELQRSIAEAYRALFTSDAVRARGERLVRLDGAPDADTVARALIAEVERAL